MINNEKESSELFMCITHKDDLDGLACGIVAKSYADCFNMEFNTMELGYKNVDEKICEFITNEEYKKYVFIVITDLGITQETAKLIDDTFKNNMAHRWLLLDHHTTNLHLNQYDWAHVREADGNGELQSAAKLAYNFWKPFMFHEYMNNLETFVNLVSDYDTYTWKEKKNQLAKDMHDFMCLVGREEFGERMTKNIFWSEDEFSIFSNEEKFVIDINKKKIKNYIDIKMKSLEFAQLLIYNGRVLNVAVTIIDEKEYSSELGNYICETIPDKADIVLMICPASQDVSMRCVRDDINLGEDIAKHLGGGGHKKAAGYRIDGIKERVYCSALNAMEHHSKFSLIKQRSE